MAIQATIYQVREEDPSVADVLLDIFFQQGNRTQTWSTSILIDRSTLPANYGLPDLAAACSTVIDTAGIVVTY